MKVKTKWLFIIIIYFKIIKEFMGSVILLKFKPVNKFDIKLISIEMIQKLILIY